MLQKVFSTRATRGVQEKEKQKTKTKNIFIYDCEIQLSFS